MVSDDLRPLLLAQSRGMISCSQQAAGEGFAVSWIDDSPTLPQRWRPLLDMVYINDAPGHEHGGHDVEGYYAPVGDGAGRACIRVFRNQNIRRRNFTIMHEMGHFLQHRDVDLCARLFEFDDIALAKSFEEQACNMFAAMSLVPDEVIASEASVGTIDARTVARVYRSSQASRQVCARRVCEVLRNGWISLTDGRGVPSMRAFSDGHADFGMPLLPVEKSAMLRLLAGGDQFCAVDAEDVAAEEVAADDCVVSSGDAQSSHGHDPRGCMRGRVGGRVARVSACRAESGNLGGLATFIVVECA